MAQYYCGNYKLCSRCRARRVIRPNTDLCFKCVRLKRKDDVKSMPTYNTFDDVDRTMPNGTLVRIEGMGYYNGVYRLRNGGTNAQGFVWGAWVFPGPMAYNHRPAELQLWPGNLPPEYRIASDDEDE